MLRSVRTVIVDEIHAVAREQARLAPGPDPGTAGSHVARAAGAAGRPVRHPAADRDGGPAAGRGRAGPRPPGRDAALRDRGLRAPPRARPGPGAARRRARRGPHHGADGADPGPDRGPRRPATGPPWSSSTPGSMAERVAHQLGERLGEELGASRRTTDPVRGTAGSGSRPGCGPGTCGRWWPRPRSSSASTSGRSSWSARSARRAASPPSCSGSADPTTPGPGRRPGGSTRPPGTSWSNAPRCCAAVRRGRLDALVVPDQPLDILAQQMVAESAAEAVGRGRAARPGPAGGAVPRPVRARTSRTSPTCWPRASAPAAAAAPTTCTATRCNGTVKGRRGARLAALTSGGAIPELGDFRVVAEPDEVQIGTVHEEWAVESRPGDVFLLGTHSWRISRVEPGTVRVTDAHGAPPSVPHWQGEAPGRTRELSEEVSALRQAVADRRAGRGPGLARAGVRHRPGRGRDHRGLPARRAGRARGAADDGPRSSWSASSTRRAGCSWSGTRPSAPG